MGRLFGTDGVRGVAGRDLTAELALGLSVAAARVLSETEIISRPDAVAPVGPQPRAARLTAIVGRDPRASGEFLEAAVVAGLASAGVDVTRVGVVPTPTVAYLTAHRGADLGVVLSASHNPAPDNGVKFFARGGHKLPDAVEDEIEARLGEDWDRPTGAAIGRVRDDGGEGAEAYVEHLVGTLPHRLDGLRIVVDCAHGAAFLVGPEVLRRAGADVIAIGVTPDGHNINDGYGSTHLGALCAAVREHGADLGLALDGDADRCLAVDAAGDVVDGDQIMAICALALQRRGQLRGDAVVATVMSNLGFKHAMAKAGIAVVETAVGDRYVLEQMRAGSYALGGEQSGHVIMLDHATTGDGLLAGLHLAAQVAATGRSLADLAQVVTRLPQVLVNVRVRDRTRVTDPALQAAVAAAAAELGDDGRVLLRPSGTEELVRVMVEAPTEDQARRMAESLAGVVRDRLA